MSTLSVKRHYHFFSRFLQHPSRKQRADAIRGTSGSLITFLTFPTPFLSTKNICIYKVYVLQINITQNRLPFFLKVVCQKHPSLIMGGNLIHATTSARTFCPDSSRESQMSCPAAKVRTHCRENLLTNSLGSKFITRKMMLV